MANRFVVLTGPPSDPGSGTIATASSTTPTAGGEVDWVQGNNYGAGIFAGKGQPFEVQAGGSISSGDDLATDSVGRAVTAGSGDTVVARALESASSGQVFWAVRR